MFENRFLRFLAAGGVNTLFGFLVYSGLILTDAPVWLALIGSTLAGTLFNFYTTGGYVFRDLSLTNLPRFLACYALIFFVNLGLISILTQFIGDKIVSQAILALPMAGLSYIVMARFVFLRKGAHGCRSGVTP